MDKFIFNMSKVDINVVRKLTLNQAIENRAIPIFIDEKFLYVLTSKEKLKNEEEIEFLFSKKIKVLKIDDISLEDIIKKVYIGEAEDLLNNLLNIAIKDRVSDIHFEPNKESVLIRFRIDGTLVLISKLKDDEYQKLLSKIKVIGNMDITEKRRPQDGKSNLSIADKNYDLRLSTIPLVYGEKLVIRILYGEVFNYDLESLNMNEVQINKLRNIVNVKNGLVVINGPTGSGKSSTLYCILKELNKSNINITTLEDPIEVLIDGINQMSLNRKANITFATGLRNILRQDPDVIMVGEIRDEETASMAVTASLTGHKVYSTIHTKTPKEVYFRLYDMGVKSYLVKDSLCGIISQRLIKVLCNDCKSEGGVINLKENKIKRYLACGCKKCNFTGYKGRSIVSSVVLIDKNIKRKLDDLDEIKDLSNYEMIENLNELLKRGKITIDDYNSFLMEEELDYEENRL